MKKSLAEIRARLKVCKEKCNYFKKHGHKHRRKHLRTRLEWVYGPSKKRDEEAEARILCIIQREKVRSYILEEAKLWHEKETRQKCQDCNREVR